MREQKEQEVFFIRDVCEMLGVSRQSLYVWIKEGKLKCNIMGSGRKCFTREQIDEFKNSRKVK